MANAAATLIKDKLGTLGTLFTSSPFQDVVDQATSEFLLTPDWEKNMNIVDQINIKLDNAKEVLKALKRRTAQTNPLIQFLALNLLETCVKNCGQSFRRELCLHKELLADVLKIATRDARKSSEYQSRDKALELINTWHHSFRSKNQYSPLTSLYQQALGKGANFTGIKVDENVLLADESISSEIVESQMRAREEKSQQRVRFAPTVSTEPAAPFQAGNRTTPYPVVDLNQSIQQTIDEAHSCIGCLTELLNANASEPAGLMTDDICHQVVVQSRHVQSQIVRAIESAPASEGTFEILLDLNDSLVKVLERYDELTKEVRAFINGVDTVHPVHQTNTPPPKPTEKNPLDDVLGDITSTPTPQSLDSLFAPTTATPPQPKKPETTLDDLFGDTKTSPPPPPPLQATPQDDDDEAFFSSRLGSTPSIAKPSPTTHSVPSPVVSHTTSTTIQTPVRQEPPAPEQEDEFDALVNRHTATTPSPAQNTTTTTKTIDDDEFDSFLNSRLK